MADLPSIWKDCKNIGMEEYTTSDNETYTVSCISVSSDYKCYKWHTEGCTKESTTRVSTGVRWTYMGSETFSLQEHILASPKISGIANVLWHSTGIHF